MKTKNKYQAEILTSMVKSVLASFLIAILFASCSKDEIAPSSNNNESSDASVIRARSNSTTVAVSELPGVAFVSLIHFAGKGDNQSYEAKAFTNGIVELRAIENLPFKGTIRYRIALVKVNALRDLFIQNRFDQLEAEYPGSRTWPTNITTFASCPECESLSVKSVKDHTVNIPQSLVKIKLSAAAILEIEKHVHPQVIDVGINTASIVDGNASH